MSTFAITAVFEALSAKAPPVVDERMAEPSTHEQSNESPTHFCAFTSDLVRTALDESPRDASRQRHPAFVSWLRRETGSPGEFGRSAASDDPRAA